MEEKSIKYLVLAPKSMVLGGKKSKKHIGDISYGKR